MSIHHWERFCGEIIAGSNVDTCCAWSPSTGQREFGMTQMIAEPVTVDCTFIEPGGCVLRCCQATKGSKVGFGLFLATNGIQLHYRVFVWAIYMLVLIRYPILNVPLLSCLCSFKDRHGP